MINIETGFGSTTGSRTGTRPLAFVDGRHRALIAGLAIALAAAASTGALASASPPPAAAPGPAAAASTPITNNEVTATDVATTPLSDLNLRKKGIPQLLIDAERAPYTLAGLNSCPRIARAVSQLNAVLGEDVDVQVQRHGKITPGGVAQSVLGSFIPFRGVIRELSGANAHDRDVQAAIFAGTARRSFLKGVGQAKGCKYPARSA
jgi:hypothetical protein